MSEMVNKSDLDASITENPVDPAADEIALCSNESNFSISSSTNRNFKVAYAHEEMNPRRRNTMEDCHRIVPDLMEDNSISYFGVYDGHGGRQIVDFMEEVLESNVKKELEVADQASIPERLARSFLITDMQSKSCNITTSGATAVVALIQSKQTANGISEKKLYCANVGDSRAVLACQFSHDCEEPELSTSGYFAKRLTFDHKAEDESEQKRIREAGGFVTRSRVLGILAVSRSFGDHGMKDFVTAEPYLSEVELSPNCPYGQCPFLILACDGVWDVFSDQEAVDFLMEKYKVTGQPFEDAAQLLVNESIERGSADNITAIIIFL